MKSYQINLPVKSDPRITVGRVALGLLFLGVIAALSGCELIYLPECDYECQAAGGADAYSKG